MKSAERIKEALGPWRMPTREVFNKVLGLPVAAMNRKFQADEINRLRKEHGLEGFGAKVVAVVVTYKRPKELVEAVESALAQNFKDLVVVVVDDGGGLTGELPDDPRLVAVSLSRNCASLGVVRNVGMGLAQSEFVAFLDDDNQWAPEHVETGVTALEADRLLSAVYTAVRRLRPDGSEMDILSRQFDRRALGVTNYVDMNSIIVRRTPGLGLSLLRRGRTTSPKEDWEFVWRLSRKGRVSHLPAVTVDYAVHAGTYYSPWDEKDSHPC